MVTVFPNTQLAARGNTVEEIRTTRGGSRKAVSIGSAVTGHGADVIIIDDLLKAADANSDAELQRAIDFIVGTLLSRFNNPSEGRVVLVAQRLHELDPAGYLMEKGTYRHLNLPAIAEEDTSIQIGPGKYHQRCVGTALFPERLGLETLDRLRREMGAAAFNCQYQHNPTSPEGSPLRWECFKIHDGPKERHRYQMVVQSWDTGMSADPRSDFSVCTTWGYFEQAWHLLDRFHAQLDSPDLKLACLRLAGIWSADKDLIEDAASGRPLLQDCHRINRSRFRAISPVQDKIVRFNAACAPIAEGLVYLPRDTHWLAEFKRELQSFPRGRNDDQVDSVSQFLNWSSGTGFWRTLDRDHPQILARRADRAQRPRH